MLFFIKKIVKINFLNATTFWASNNQTRLRLSKLKNSITKIFLYDDREKIFQYKNYTFQQV